MQLFLWRRTRRCRVSESNPERKMDQGNVTNKRKKEKGKEQRKKDELKERRSRKCDFSDGNKLVAFKLLESTENEKWTEVEL